MMRSTTHPTSTPTSTPTPASTKKRTIDSPQLNTLVTAAATAERYRISADASFTRLSPSRITITRRGTGSRDTIAAAATASGGETIAPSATATAHGMVGKSARAVIATAAVVAKIGRASCRERVWDWVGGG